MDKDLIYQKAEEKAEKELCNKKCLCPNWKDAGLCSSCDVFMGLREYYASQDIKELHKMTYKEIDKLSKSGKAADFLNIGDEMDVELITGEVVTFAIAGFNHDIKSDDGKVAGITFIAKNVIDGEFEINSYIDSNYNSTNKGGWDKSKMRNDYMQRLFKLLPVELQNVIKTVDKFTGGGKDNKELIKSQDKLFLPSQVEVFDDEDDVVKGEGERYPYFADINNRIAKRGGGSNVWWWLRSPYVAYSTYFCSVSISGYANYDGASYSSGVRPAFCI